MPRFRVPRVVAQLLLAATVALLLGVGVASPARADETKSVSYVDADGVSRSVTAAVVDDSTHELGGDPDGSSWYVVTSNTTIDERVEVSGDVNLILADGACLTASEGIHVPEGRSLTIYAQKGGTGELVATASGALSGIGGDAAENCGAVTINGGVVEARGHTGIGGGQAQTHVDDGGDGGFVTINGGRVTATGAYGAGIGGGVRGGEVTLQTVPAEPLLSTAEAYAPDPAPARLERASAAAAGRPRPRAWKYTTPLLSP